MNSFQIPEKIQSQIYRNKKGEALWLLGKLINDIDNSLFSEQYQDFINFVNVYRIRLCMDWRLYREALAYTCLEAEMNPSNANAHAYKEFIKTRVNNSLNTKKKSEAKNINDGWKGVAGMRELKTIFERDIILPFTEREIYDKYKVPLPNGILLYGPPGCGKTFIARKLAEQIKFYFLEVKPSNLGSTYVHGTQLEIKRIFEEAEKNRPSLVFFDEIEAIVPNRKNSDVSFHYKSEVNEFLTQLDQCNKRGIFVVGATNYLRNIDDAILRPGRFDKKVFVSFPDLEARAEAFKIQMEGRPQEDIKWHYLAEMTEFYTFADIEHIVNEAGRIAISNKTLINTNTLGSSIVNVKPSLSKEKIAEYFR